VWTAPVVSQQGGGRSKLSWEPMAASHPGTRDLVDARGDDAGLSSNRQQPDQERGYRGSNR